MVIDEVRKQVGPFFPIMLRLSADELMEGGNTLEDTLEYLDYLQEEVDIFDVPADLTVPSSTRSMQIISRTDGVPTCKGRKRKIQQAMYLHG